ncbi:DUF2357 domain-containing protein [Psychroserpens jangbogonensis]|uniref:DUF2357 domain-containing protein n=1 Tax=Psychroserpens jangbogonensis TaxID=1484460 RepID=UPI00053CF993|nr:DUF2357 domain-containing protein [Psychroserpens jangbogonensis]
MQKLKINLSHIAHDLDIDIYAVIPNTLFQIADALENNEAEFQIIEGCYYQYKLKKGFYLEGSEVIEVSNFNNSEGRISPNTYVGTLPLSIYENGILKGTFQLEVQSVKTSYRKDYRFMLESITKHATDLILQTNSPVNQTLEVDFDTDSKSLYQQFCFVKSIIDTEEFDIAIQQIIKSPVTNWSSKIEYKDVRSLKKLKSKDLRQLIHSQNRVPLPSSHPLRNSGINSIAVKIPTSIHDESIDTPENRFIKYVLETFLFFCEEIILKSKKDSRLNNEAQTISNKLEFYLQHNLFKEVSRPTTLKLNSPVLQKKAGYRDVLKTWLMFDLSAKLIWEGGEDVYSAGNKDVAKLYEYWLFFKLLEAVKETFTIDSEEYKKLIKPTADTLGLQLKEGKQIALNGTHISKERELSIKFSYNKTFGRNHDLSKEGSWTLQMRPDYTLSIWPKELHEKEAEKTEQIVHIHFDAKYKVKNKQDNSKFKEVDIHKMHAYKDAIRRTGGAYILYPGIDNKPTTFKGFHEILPGLGAFAIRPSEENSGINHLIDFINEIKKHFINRATQRENVSTKTYQIIKDKPLEGLNEPIPEYLNGEKLIPDETYVLVGFYNNQTQYEWISKKGMYNFRMGSGNGSLVLDNETVSAKYLLLHTHNDKSSGDLWKIVSKGPKVYTKENLIKKGYINPSQEYYLVIELEKVNLSDFGENKWDFRKLKNYNSGNASAKPFTTTLTELIHQKIEN